MGKLYIYLKNKLKTRDISLDEFAAMCGFSKSTLYRYMKSIQVMPIDIQQKICQLLNLNSYEQQELKEILNTAYISDTTFEAREILYKLIFNQNNCKIIPSEIEVILYDDDKYLRTLKDVFNIVLKASSNKDFSCKIHMIGCIDENVIYNITKFIEAKGIRDDALEIEQIINLPKNLCNQVIENISILFPLFQFYNYNIYYTSYEAKEPFLSILNDCIIMRYNHFSQNNNEEKYIFISFFKDKFSECYISKDKNLYTFFIKNYNSIKQKCQNNLIKYKNLDILGSTYENIQKNSDIYIIQHTPSYNKIPEKVFHLELKRYNDKQLLYLANSLNNKKQNILTARGYMLQLIEYISKRIKFSKINKSIDIYTKEGIKNFIITRKLSNHVNGMLPFSKESINIIMENLIKRNADPKDNYNMYIFNDNISNEIFWKIMKENGIIIKYNSPIEKNHNVTNLFIENQDICKIFADFIENHMTTNNVMSRSEADDYIYKLLDKYCS